jgi:hyperosmotically inducible periplasmic protein
MGHPRTLVPLLAAVLLMGAGCARDRGAAVRGPSADRSVADIGSIGRQRIEQQVRSELIRLPFYGVFDNLAFRVEGDTVHLFGQVTRPTLKSDAENVVRSIEAVDRVVNRIEVLPVSFQDDRIRVAAYRAIFTHPGLDRYALQPVPPIRIIVRNGNIALEGVVASEMDKTIANMQARQVPGVFSVTNNLEVAPS